MKFKNAVCSGHPATSSNYKFCFKRLLCGIILALILCAGTLPSHAKEKWAGVDEAVIEKHAKKYGVQPREPFINTDQGDLLLFIFTLAGAVGGFVAGYNFRKIFKEKKSGTLP
jgi:ABC-type cobalt transport system substrate-binding protein